MVRPFRLHHRFSPPVGRGRNDGEGGRDYSKPPLKKLPRFLPRRAYVLLDSKGHIEVRGRSNRGTTHHPQRAARYHSRDEAATIFETQRPRRTQRTTTTATSSAQHHPRHDISVGMTFRDARRSQKEKAVDRRDDDETNALRPKTSAERSDSAAETASAATFVFRDARHSSKATL